MELEVYVDWPHAPLTNSLVLRALANLSLRPLFVSTPSRSDKPFLQWAAYDSLDHGLTLSKPSAVLASSFTIRKALIRKHFLHRCILAYTTKYPESFLVCHVPRTWDFEISYADELDELWSDELWDLAEELGRVGGRWWILKPGMADRGMGIRLFNTKNGLQRIFEEFEASGEDENGEEANIGIETSQLRHFVIQEYLSSPVLLDPNEHTTGAGEVIAKRKLEGRKFHLRAYCVVSGALSVYLYPRILALFASEPYQVPSASKNMTEDLRRHLTNTCLQGTGSEANVCLLDELVGCSVLSGNGANYRDSLSNDDFASIVDQISDTLCETMKAAIQMPVHFQPLPNAFELYGVDFLVCNADRDRGEDGRFVVKLLEFNSEPAIEMTGDRLKWILEDLFDLIAKTCVEPFFSGGKGANVTNTGKSEWKKCLVINIRE